VTDAEKNKTPTKVSSNTITETSSPSVGTSINTQFGNTPAIVSTQSLPQLNQLETLSLLLKVAQRNSVMNQLQNLQAMMMKNALQNAVTNNIPNLLLNKSMLLSGMRPTTV